MGVDTKDGAVFSAYSGWNKFELTSRSHTSGEFVRETIEIFGKYEDLVNMGLTTGDGASKLGVPNLSGFYIESATINRGDGEEGVCSANVVKVGSPTNPYHFTISVGMEAVQRKLITHPDVTNDESMKWIRWWENTPEAVRVDWKDAKNPKFKCYMVTTNGEVLENLTEIKDENANRYCQAVVAGIDSYQVYLPVLTQTSDYLRLPGVSVDADTKETSGKLSPKNGALIGTYCAPPIEIEGFKDGKWFKSEDKFSQNSNGTWTRNESWVYTNDLRFTWIYDKQASTKVVKGKNSGGGSK